MNWEDKKKLDSSIELNRMFSTNNVGSCIKLLRELKNSLKRPPSFEEWRGYYFKKVDLTKLSEIKAYIMSLGYSEKVSKEYVFTRTVKQTYNGTLMEAKAKEHLEKERGLNLRYSTEEEDTVYCIDLVDDAKNLAFQVKPISYLHGSNPSLNKDKERNKEAHIKSKFKVEFIYYSKKRNQITFTL
jgi:hypothetical protein